LAGKPDILNRILAQLKKHASWCCRR
jgi:hypothetical protein